MKAELIISVSEEMGQQSIGVRTALSIDQQIMLLNSALFLTLCRKFGVELKEQKPGIVIPSVIIDPNVPRM